MSKSTVLLISALGEREMQGVLGAGGRSSPGHREVQDGEGRYPGERKFELSYRHGEQGWVFPRRRPALAKAPRSYGYWKLGTRLEIWVRGKVQ